MGASAIPPPPDPERLRRAWERWMIRRERVRNPLRPVAAARTSTPSSSGRVGRPAVGRAWEFDRLRPYEPGDPISDLDWNATARLGIPHLRAYREERTGPVWVVLDVSSSVLVDPLIRVGTRHLGLMILETAHRAGRPLGLIEASDRIERVDPPHQPRPLSAWRRRLATDPGPPRQVARTDPRIWIDHLDHWARRHGSALVLAVGDGWIPPEGRAALSRFARTSRHFFTMVDVYSRHRPVAPWSVEPRPMRDAETGEVVWVGPMPAYLEPPPPAEDVDRLTLDFSAPQPWLDLERCLDST